MGDDLGRSNCFWGHDSRLRFRFILAGISRSEPDMRILGLLSVSNVLAAQRKPREIFFGRPERFQARREEEDKLGGNFFKVFSVKKRGNGS